MRSSSSTLGLLHVCSSISPRTLTKPTTAKTRAFLACTSNSPTNNPSCLCHLLCLPCSFLSSCAMSLIKCRSLEIKPGMQKSKLSHSHSTHYTYVRQSLTLWLRICQQMFRLWHAADSDLLGERGYHLSNTGQGMNRVRYHTSRSRILTRKLSGSAVS